MALSDDLAVSALAVFCLFSRGRASAADHLLQLAAIRVGDEIGVRPGGARPSQAPPVPKLTLRCTLAPMRRLGAGAVVVAMMMLCACASPAVGLPWPHSEAGLANLAAAREDARLLLNALPVPPGATPSLKAPPGTPPILSKGPGRPLPTTAHAWSWWTVPGEPGAAIEWMIANPPAGVASLSSGTAVEFGSEEQARIGEFTWPEVPNVLTHRMLYAAAVPGSSGSSILRADALVSWFLPRPAEEQIPDSVRVLEVADERIPSGTTRLLISRSRTVRRIAALIDGLPASAAEKAKCLRNRPNHYLRLTFRARPGGPALAEASETLPALGDCRPLALRLDGKPQMPLAEGQAIYKALATMLAAQRSRR
jgi:hypothetical protein